MIILHLRIETMEWYSIGLKSSSVGEKSFTSCIPIAGHSDPDEGLVPRMHFSSAFQTVFVDCKIIGIYFLHHNNSNHCKCSIKSAFILWKSFTRIWFDNLTQEDFNFEKVISAACISIDKPNYLVHANIFLRYRIHIPIHQLWFLPFLLLEVVNFESGYFHPNGIHCIRNNV